jgi:hypothetical protein
MRMEAKTSPHTESSFADGVDVGVGVDVFIPWNIKSVPFFTCTCVKCGHVVKGDTAVEARQAFEPHACPVVNAEASARRLFAYANLPQCERPAETPEGKIARLQRALSIMTDHALSRSVAANTFEKERNAARAELATAKSEIGRSWNAHGEVKAICQEQAAGLMAALQAKGIAERERDALKAAAELGALVLQMKPGDYLQFRGYSDEHLWSLQRMCLGPFLGETPEEVLKAAFNQLIPTPERQD